MTKVKELANKYKDYTIALRRDFHMYPEASMKEYKTSGKILKELNKMNIECEKVADTGVIATIKGKGDGKTIALRADIDALEVKEENNVSYKSRNEGLMHACGHDGHTASLLTAAKILNDIKDEFSGSVKLIFQPGEEVALGAKKMITNGALEDVDGIFGIHIWNDLEAGKVSVEKGPRMASAGKFSINVEGKGGHGSMPHQGVDAVLVGSAIVMNLQSVVSREISPLDPSVLSVGIFNSGSRFNVMAGSAYLEGTTRCFNMEVNDRFEDIIKRIVNKTCETYKAKAKVKYEQLVIPTINDDFMSEIGENAVKKLKGLDAVSTYEKTTGGEDFSFYTVNTPSAFAFVGSKNEKKVDYYPHHHSKFDIDEEALLISSGLYAQFAIDFLNK
ncbi:MAG: amidohydrolase [Firmicutes bacterium]|nr:amidohydrolase [Bacillota bacterium]